MDKLDTEAKEAKERTENLLLSTADPFAFNQNESLPTTETDAKGNILKTLGRFGNMFKHITGRPNWWEPPKKNIEDICTQLDKKVDSTTGPITKTVNMAELQVTIDALPKIIRHSVNIYVNPGEIPDVINVSGFTCIGGARLNIRGASEAKVFTHKCGGFAVHACNAASVIEISGFTAMNTDGESFLVHQSTGYVYIFMNNSIGGSPSTSGLTGFSAVESNFAYFSGCYAENKNIAYNTHMSQAYIGYGNDGKNNSVIYRAHNGGTLQIRSEGTTIGTTRISKSGGGLIINADGTLA